jgi:ribosomal protein S18 acetylase RimI-like enzyme
MARRKNSYLKSGCMMITLRKMKAEEFSNYHDYFIVDYAADIAANFGYTPEISRAIALKELADDLPQNVSTPDNFLLCIEKNDADLIGYLWYELLNNGETVFILDFVVFDKFRGMGYGTAALNALEKQLSQAGVEQIKLRVAHNNQRALKLYEKVGFNITGYNMVKDIKSQG